MNKDELIMDDGVIRCCPSNRARMGYWENFKHFHSYKDLMNEFVASCSELLEAFLLIFRAVVFVVLIPILPFVQCWFSRRKAIKEVSRDEV